MKKMINFYTGKIFDHGLFRHSYRSQLAGQALPGTDLTVNPILLQGEPVVIDGKTLNDIIQDIERSDRIVKIKKNTAFRQIQLNWRRRRALYKDLPNVL